MSRFGLVILILVIGALVGGAVSEALREPVPWLARSAEAGFDLRELSLAGVVVLDFGLRLKVNLGTVIGLLAATWIASRLNP